MLDDSASDAKLLDVICHEAGHLLGTLDHGGTGLARYAWIHDYKTWVVLGRPGAMWDPDNRCGAAYVYSTEITRYRYTERPAPSEVENITLRALESGVESHIIYDYEHEELLGWLPSTDGQGHPIVEHTRLDPIYVEVTEESEYSYRASGMHASGTITVLGGEAVGCTAKNISVSGVLLGYDVRTDTSPCEGYPNVTWETRRQLQSARPEGLAGRLGSHAWHVVHLWQI